MVSELDAQVGVVRTVRVEHLLDGRVVVVVVVVNSETVSPRSGRHRIRLEAMIKTFMRPF